MSKRAEERALEAYPDVKKEDGYDPDTEIWVTQNLPLWRKSFIKGYEQAEKDIENKIKYSSGPDGFCYGKGYDQAKKDLELTVNDIKSIIAAFYKINGDIRTMGDLSHYGTEEYYKEILDAYKEKRE